jgi:hypothetical protein
MAHENVAITQGFYEAIGARDIPTLLAAMDPNIEWYEC